MRAEMGKDPTRAPQSQLNLPPGFRFYPTDEELVVHYLCKKAACEPFAVPIIAEVELYKFNPWDLPERALFGEKEWYFFSPRDRKYPNGSRPNRAAGTGYWKATGTDKPISTMGGTKKVGVKKALVFYKGKAPKGIKTNWIMHEYRLADCGGARLSAKRKGSLRLDDWVLCRIYKKSSSAAALMKTASNTPVDIKVEQSESSCLDDVLATLSELDDPTNGVRPADVEVEGTDSDMQLGAMETKSSLGNRSQEAASHSSDMRAYMKEVQEKPGMANQVSHGGMKYADVNNYARQNAAAATPEMNYYARQNMVAAMPEMNYYMRQNAVATPESNTTSSRQYSPLESYSTSGLQQEEEDLTVESTFNSLAGLPLTQLLNTQNLAFSSSPFGLDLGLPSPCSMLASGGNTFGGGSLIDPDNYPFQTSQWGWDPTRVNYSS